MADAGASGLVPLSQYLTTRSTPTPASSDRMSLSQYATQNGIQPTGGTPRPLGGGGTRPPVPTADGGATGLQTGLGALKAAPGFTSGLMKLFNNPDFNFSNITDATGLIGTGLSLAGGATGNKALSQAGQATSAATSVANAGYSAANGGTIGGGYGGILAAAGRVANGLMDVSQNHYGDDAPLMLLHHGALAAADYFTGGLAELGPMIGNAIGKDNIIGKMMIGLPAFLGPPSRYNAVRDLATNQAQDALGGLNKAYAAAKPGNLNDTWNALATKLGPHGAVRSLWSPPADIAKTLGLAVSPAGQVGWDSMTPQQFQGAMQWISQDPRRLSSVTGSGDVPYAPQAQAEQYAQQASNAARGLIAKQLGLPYLGANYDRNEAQWAIQADNLSPRQIFDNASNEEQYMRGIAKWNKAHPNVPMSYDPVYLDGAKALMANIRATAASGAGSNDEAARAAANANAIPQSMP